MTKDEALNRANALRDKIFASYCPLQFMDESLGGSVKLPREGDWVGWIARAILDAANGEGETPEQSMPMIDMEDVERMVKEGEIEFKPFTMQAGCGIDYIMERR
jgi:hypothetical protein